MLPQLHVDKVFNMQISQADAELLDTAIMLAGRYSHLFDVVTPAQWDRLKAMQKQLAQLAGWQEQ